MLERFGQFFGESAVGASIAGASGAAALAAARRALLDMRLRTPLRGIAVAVPGMRRRVRSVRPLMSAVARALGRSMGRAVRTRRERRTRLPFRLRRLRRIRAQQTIFERCTIEAADDGVHLLRIRRIDERESLGFLRFGIADHFNGVRDQVFG